MAAQVIEKYLWVTILQTAAESVLVQRMFYVLRTGQHSYEVSST